MNSQLSSSRYYQQNHSMTFDCLMDSEPDPTYESRVMDMLKLEKARKYVKWARAEYAKSLENLIHQVDEFERKHERPAEDVSRGCLKISHVIETEEILTSEMPFDNYVQIEMEAKSLRNGRLNYEKYCCYKKKASSNIPIATMKISVEKELVNETTGEKTKQEGSKCAADEETRYADVKERFNKKENKTEYEIVDLTE